MAIDCLLINPYFLRFDPTQKSKRSPYEPLGLMYIGKVLKNEGYRVSLLDCTFLSSVDEAKDIIKSLNPTAIGITSKITLTKNVAEFISFSKLLGSVTIIGGPDPSLRPERYLRLGADFVVIGEGEETIRELLPCVIKGDDPSNVKGLAFIKKNTIVYTPARPFIKDFDKLGAPDRSLIDVDKYRNTWLEDHGFAMATVMTSRGCPYSCNFCSNPIAPFGRRYTYRSSKNVVDELEEVVLKYGFDRIWFADDVFTINRERTIAICKEIIDRGLQFKWSCLTRADRVDEYLLKLMKKSGCEEIFYGLESGAQEILDAMNRNMKVEAMRRGMLMTKKAGIRIHTFVQVGYPGENYRTLIKTLEFMKEIMPDEFSFTISYPLPGTKLYDLVEFIDDPDSEWDSPSENRLLFKSDIPNTALRFFIKKTKIELALRRRYRKAKLPEKVFNRLSNVILKLLARSAGKYDWNKRSQIISRYLRYEQKTRFR